MCYWWSHGSGEGHRCCSQGSLSEEVGNGKSGSGGLVLETKITRALCPTVGDSEHLFMADHQKIRRERERKSKIAK